MQQITGTLTSLVIYLALVAVGAFLGSRPVLRSRPLPWLGRVQTAALLLLILTLGAELGANEEITASLGLIGLNAFLITAAAMAGSLLAGHILRKYILKLDKQGQPAGSAQTQQTHGETAKVDHTLTLIIVAATLCSLTPWSSTAARSSSWDCTCCCFWSVWTWDGRKAFWPAYARQEYGWCWCRWP